MKLIALLSLILPALATANPSGAFVLRAFGGPGYDFINNHIINPCGHQPDQFCIGNYGYPEFILSCDENGILYDQNGVGILINPKTGYMGSVPCEGCEPTPGFGFNGDHLIFEGKDSWKACMQLTFRGDRADYVFSVADCDGGIPVVLKKVDIEAGLTIMLASTAAL